MSGKLRRIDSEFADKFFDDIKLKRLKLGKDKRMVSDKRISLAMKRHPLIKKIKSDIIHAELRPQKRTRKINLNRRGAATDLFIWIIVGFILLIFLAVFIYGFNELTNVLTGITDADNNIVNVTSAATDTFGQVNTGLTVWYWSTGLIIFALGISILVSNFLVKSNPVFVIPYILIVVIAVIFAVFISNAYETVIRNDSVIGGTIQNFIGADFIFLNLPIWITVIGLLGGILLFIGIIRDRETGGSFL